ncbi:hypothetical protein LUZ63_012467 [Rhynchospora breviuscula]|uniref:Uncharacterized protein n=1 Tax=Rhynchospora breviuscula TaxID=2022672 RepID=A0A9Q0CKR1_9POAL|nr:hypothetical protein LUZ63_012467 [Rhynchospora breviuscula]
MGNTVASLISSFTNPIGDFLRAPLDFLSGKSCSSVCGPTWDLICYIENFCVANLIKLLAVLVLLYIVLLFVYLLYKIGICKCIGKGFSRMLRACMSSCFNASEYTCMYLCYKIKRVRRIREEQKQIEMEDYLYSSSTTEDDIEEARYATFRRTFSQKFRGDRRQLHMQRSLKPRSRRIRVGISKHSIVMDEREPRRRHRHGSSVHNIRVTHTSRFVQKAHGRRIHRSTW